MLTRKVILLFSLIALTPLVFQGADLSAVELRLQKLHKDLSQSSTDENSQSICNSMRQAFIESFDDPATFDYPFEKLNFCKITSSDGRIRLFNWNLPYQDGTHTYYCFVLVRDLKKKTYTWTELKDYAREADKIENRFIQPDKWLGTLYYEIIPMDKKGRGDTYTLLGWDGVDRLTNRKIIDAITITGDKIRIGAGIFKSDDGTRKRMILEYSDEVSASVRYYPNKKCIVMDHLSPKNPMMQGIYADYGPDGSYDLLFLKKGKWELIEDVDISEFAEGNNRPFVDPRPGRNKSTKQKTR